MVQNTITTHQSIVLIRNWMLLHEIDLYISVPSLNVIYDVKLHDVQWCQRQTVCEDWTVLHPGRSPEEHHKTEIADYTQTQGRKRMHLCYLRFKKSFEQRKTSAVHCKDNVLNRKVSHHDRWCTQQHSSQAVSRLRSDHDHWHSKGHSKHREKPFSYCGKADTHIDKCAGDILSSTWLRSWDSTLLSKSFETNERLDMGLTFFNTFGSRDGFLKRGLINAFFKEFDTMPGATATLKSCYHFCANWGFSERRAK